MTTSQYSSRSFSARRRFLRTGIVATSLGVPCTVSAQWSPGKARQHTLLIANTKQSRWLHNGASFFAQTVAELSAQSLQFSQEQAHPEECIKRLMLGDAQACIIFLRDWQSAPQARDFFAGIPGGMNSDGLIGWFYEGEGLRK